MFSVEDRDVSLAPKTHVTFDEWLTAERERLEGRTEFVGGEVFGLAGGSREHNLITTNIVRKLGMQFKGRPCCVYSGNLKVKVDAAEAGAYPDVMAICGEHLCLDDKRDVVTNPALIIEVLSDSTEAYDRGDKFALYRGLQSLEAYLLIAQNRVCAELYVRQPDGGWLLHVFEELAATLPLAVLDASLALTEVYDKVEWAARGAATGSV
jgi:Uma2 family endonuclease